MVFHVPRPRRWLIIKSGQRGNQEAAAAASVVCRFIFTRGVTVTPGQFNLPRSCALAAPMPICMHAVYVFCHTEGTMRAECALSAGWISQLIHSSRPMRDLRRQWTWTHHTSFHCELTALCFHQFLQQHFSCCWYLCASVFWWNSVFSSNMSALVFYLAFEGLPLDVVLFLSSYSFISRLVTLISRFYKIYSVSSSVENIIIKTLLQA